MENLSLKPGLNTRSIIKKRYKGSVKIKVVEIQIGNWNQRDSTHDPAKKMSIWPLYFGREGC